MSAPALPGLNDLVDVSLTDGACHASRVEDVDGATFTVAAPADLADPDRPGIGAHLELAWLRGGGRLAVCVQLVAVTGDLPRRWVLRALDEPRRRSRRVFVRGGGGERIRLNRRSGPPAPAEGEVADLGEGSVRCRLRTGEYEPGDRLDIGIHLDDGVVEVVGRVRSVEFDPASGYYHLIATYDPDEILGRRIRRYVLHRQMEQRRRGGAVG